MSDIEKAAQAILDYADQHQRHVRKIAYDPAINDFAELCNVEAGDRCDITAAYRHAAVIVRQFGEA